MKIQKVKVGMKIKIGTPTGNDYGTELNWSEYNILEVEENPNNNIVPYSITVSSGKYIPTSGADGYWQGSINLGGWEIIC